MARPNKFNERQWSEIENRVPPAGTESIRSVAKELGVSEGVIRKRVKTHTKPLNQLANQIAATEIEFESLPVNTQVKVRTLADRLKGISHHLGSAAEYGAMTSHKLAQMANAEVQKVDDINPMDSTDILQGISALTKLSNDAAQTGINLIRATQTTMAKQDDPVNLTDLTDAQLLEIASGS